MYEDEEQEVFRNDGCAGVRADLKNCIKESECYMNGGTLKGCLRDRDVPQECLALMNTFFSCKRSMVDNRTRFRGKKGY